MTKKSTFTCKVCGGEHRGLICEKFNSGEPVATKGKKPVLALAAPPIAADDTAKGDGS